VFVCLSVSDLTNVLASDTPAFCVFDCSGYAWALAVRLGSNKQLGVKGFQACGTFLRCAWHVCVPPGVRDPEPAVCWELVGEGTAALGLIDAVVIWAEAQLVGDRHGGRQAWRLIWRGCVLLRSGESC
jgi:hypothetical protein